MTRRTLLLIASASALHAQRWHNEGVKEREALSCAAADSAFPAEGRLPRLFESRVGDTVVVSTAQWRGQAQAGATPPEGDVRMRLTPEGRVQWFRMLIAAKDAPGLLHDKVARLYVDADTVDVRVVGSAWETRGITLARWNAASSELPTATLLALVDAQQAAVDVGYVRGTIPRDRGPAIRAIAREAICRGLPTRPTESFSDAAQVARARAWGDTSTTLEHVRALRGYVSRFLGSELDLIEFRGQPWARLQPAWSDSSWNSYVMDAPARLARVARGELAHDLRQKLGAPPAAGGVAGIALPLFIRHSDNSQPYALQREQTDATLWYIPFGALKRFLSFDSTDEEFYDQVTVLLGGSRVRVDLSARAR